jgi:hypothetical protein
MAQDVGRDGIGIAERGTMRCLGNGGTEHERTRFGLGVDQPCDPDGRHLAVVAPIGSVGQLAPTLIEQPTPKFITKTCLDRHAKVAADNTGADGGLGAATWKSTFSSKAQQTSDPIAQGQIHHKASPLLVLVVDPK